MRRLALTTLVLAAVGCDAGADVTSDPGRFTADLSGARSALTEGEASFPIVRCGGEFAFASAAGTLRVRKECFERDDRARERRYPVDKDPSRDTFEALFTASDGTRYIGTDGSVTFVDIEREQVEGRFDIEAKPVGTDGQIDSRAAALTITGEFNASGYAPPPGYD